MKKKIHTKNAILLLKPLERVQSDSLWTGMEADTQGTLNQVCFD